MTRITTTKDLRFRAPKPKKCECVAVGDGLLKRLEHEQFCPLRLWGEEREAYLEQVHREKKTTR